MKIHGECTPERTNQLALTLTYFQAYHQRQTPEVDQRENQICLTYDCPVLLQLEMCHSNVVILHNVGYK